MTSKEIFEKGNILTIGKAKQIAGKYIYITNCEYKANKPTVRKVFVAPISEWDAARQDKTAKDFPNWQEYCKSFMNEKQIDRMKNSYHIGKNELGNFEGGTLNGNDDTPFYGSDADREIYYLECC